MKNKMEDSSESMSHEMSEPADIKEIPDHEVEMAAMDIMKAEKHKSNKGLMMKVHKHLAKQKVHIDSVTKSLPKPKSIEDLQDMRNKKMLEDNQS